MFSKYTLIILASVASGLGRLEPTRYESGVSKQWQSVNGMATMVCDIIAFLEQSESSLSKGVMVVATDWSGAADDMPKAFLRTLHGRLEQPVYAADVDHLLADGRPPPDETDPRHGRDGENAAGTAGRRPLPTPCRPPTTFADRDGGGGVRALLLPLRSQYVVLFWSDDEPPPGPVDALSQLSYAFWDVNVYYLIAVPVFDRDVQRTVYSVWRNMSIYKIVVVTPTVIKMLDPFARNTVDDGRFANVPLWALERIPDMLRSRIRNIRRFPLRFLINERPPTVVPTKDGGAYIGQDGEFAALLAAQLNATPVYYAQWSDNGKISYGYRRTPNGTHGTFAGIVDGWADVSVNGHFLKDYNCYMAELTRHITSDKVCLLAPKAGIIPPVMTVLMSFQLEVWMMTAVTCFMVTLIYYAATVLDTRRPGPTGCNLGLEIYRMFIGAPTNRVFAHSCQRILTSFCLVFTLVILNAFQGSLVTFLNTPMHYSDINTFTDLQQSDLPIRTSSISFKEILTGDPNLKSLAYRVEKWAKEEDIHYSDGRFAGFQRVNVFNLGHFKDVLYIANKNKTRVLHTMNECLISYFISYVIHRNSPYKRRINILLSWIDQAGLVLKWNSDVSKYIFDKYKPINPKDYESSKVFSVRDLEIAFLVLSFGIVLSIVTFIVEILMPVSPKKHPAPRTLHLPFVH